MADVSPQSYQTTMPEYPDVSYERWDNLYGGYKGLGPYFFFRNSRIGSALMAWASGNPNYETWRQNLLDKYNSQVSEYNAWASSPLGQRTQNEEAGYNASYQSGATSQGSPLSYQDVNPGSGFSEMAQGIQGIFAFASALQGMKMLASQIQGQELKNEAQRINNAWLDKILGNKASLGGFQNDKLQYELEQLFYPRWSKYPELWKGGVFSPYGRGTYDLRDADLGFTYQRQVADLDFLKAGKVLRDQQAEIMKLDRKAKEFYNQNLLELQKDILSGQVKLINGQVDWQPIEFALRKKSIQWGIGLNAANTAISAIKTGISLFTGSGLLSLPGTQSNFPGSWSSGNTWTPGVDFGTGEIYGSYGQ